jgi:hypothetical protein
MIEKFALPVIAALSLLAAASAQAQPAGGGGGGLREACQADFQKFCASVQGGGGAKMQCMKQHASELSDTCKAAFLARMKARQSGASGQGGGQGQ